MSEYAPHDKSVVIGDVADRYAEQIIPLARHGVAFDDFLAGLDELLELRAGRHRLPRHPHLAQHVYRSVEKVRVGEADGLAEHSGFFKIADAPPDRGGRSADPFGQGGMAEACIALQLADDSPVHHVQMISFFHEDHFTERK